MARKEDKDLEQQNPNQEDKDLEQQNPNQEDKDLEQQNQNPENKDLDEQNQSNEDKNLDEQNRGEDDMAKEEIKVKLKSNYPKFDKDGKKIGKYKPDETITLPFAEAEKLIKNAMAVEV